jgi:hypothetical protein
MRHMRILPSFLVLACAGCMTEPIATAPTNNAQIQVDLLFEHEGCRVFRFRDIGYHYFVKCDAAGPNASTDPPQAGRRDTSSILPDQCGKSGHECGSVPAN